jgi:nucleoside-diphosphate-sugar epimerase
MKVLVTGARGMIGSHICRSLLKAGDLVRGIFLPGEDAADLEREGVEVFRGDITRAETLKGCTRGCEIVYHCAARVTDWGARRLFVESIVDGTHNLLEASLGEARRFVYLSSIAAYGLKYHNRDATEDVTLRKVGIPYGDCKADAEAICHSYAGKQGLEMTIIRPSNVLGPGSAWVRDVLDAFSRGPVPLINKGRCETAFVFVENLVEGIITASRSASASGRTYHFCDDYKVTWKEYETILGELVDKKPKGSLPFGVAWSAGHAMEIACLPLGVRPPMSRLAVGVMGRENHVDCTRARKELGWSTRVSWDEAMEITINWVREVYLPGKAAPGK